MLADVLALAKPNPGADIEAIEIFGSDGSSFTVDSTQGSFELRSGDRVTVPTLPSSNEVIVLGGVANPGVVAFTRGQTLGDAMKLAGGLSGHGDATAIVVMRGRTPINLSVPADASFPMKRGDTVKVGLTSDRKFVAVLGGVVRPGSIEYHNGMTLSQLVSAAGGVSPRGRGDIVFVREVASPRSKPAIYDLNAIKAGRVADPVISPGESIEVGLRT